MEWLKKRDLVTLEPDPQDRRGKLVVLTPAGKDYIQTKVAPIMQAEERAFLPAHAGAAGGADHPHPPDHKLL